MPGYEGRVIQLEAADQAIRLVRPVSLKEALDWYNEQYGVDLSDQPQGEALFAEAWQGAELKLEVGEVTYTIRVKDGGDISGRQLPQADGEVWL